MRISIFNEERHADFFDILMKSNYGTVSDARTRANIPGVYAFFDGSNAIYVGRTQKRGLGDRMKNHLARAHNQAVLAYKLAKKELDYATSYSGSGTRAARMKEEKFIEVFNIKLSYVSRLNVKFVQIENPDDQYLFEYYACQRLKSPNNDFEAH